MQQGMTFYAAVLVLLWSTLGIDWVGSNVVAAVHKDRGPKLSTCNLPYSCFIICITSTFKKKLILQKKTYFNTLSSLVRKKPKT